MGISCSPWYGKSTRFLQGKASQVLVLGLLFFVAHSSASTSQETTAEADTFRPKSRSLLSDAEQMGYEVQKGDALLNFTLSDGDVVACYPIKAQPSLKFAAPGRPIVPLQMWPSSVPKRGNSTVSSRGAKLANQRFNVEFGSCPKGTIPVRRSRDIYNLTSLFFETQSTEDDVQRSYASTRDLENQYRKFIKHGPRSLSQPSDGNYTENNDDGRTPHEHAFVVVNNTEPMHGMEVLLNIWEPFVEDKDEFSLAQFWLISGSYKGKNYPVGNSSYTTILNTIEAGWQVFEGLYGDNRSRLFLFWTSDAYNETGCYNLYCSGFVQVSNKVLVGGSFTPVSQINSSQYEIDLLVFRDKSSGNWWLLLNDEPVGYWPSVLFTGQLRDGASYMEFGGEIIDDEHKGHNRHTRTKMGSGNFPQAGHTQAAYQRNIQYVDDNLHLHDAHLVMGKAEAPRCYKAQITTDFPDWGSNFFFGGRGYSPICPHGPSAER